VWAIYASSWLALEAIVLGERIERWPTFLRHTYVLLIVIVGWVILRADSAGGAMSYLRAMAGLSSAAAWTSSRYLTLPVVSALVVALIGAGPLVPGVSRWRVSVDAMTASIVMMLTAVPVFVWSVVPWRRRESPR
jgi:alginate O-acetyltransferase complex protein AlgI